MINPAEIISWNFIFSEASKKSAEVIAVTE